MSRFAELDAAERDALRVLVTEFQAARDPQGARRWSTDWPELFAWIVLPRPNIPKGGDGQGWSPATFRNDYRADVHVESISALVEDYDQGGSIGEIRERWKGCLWFAHESRSSTPDAPRYRLILPWTRPVTGEEHDLLWSALHSRAGNVDTAARNRGRFWFAGCRLSDGSSPATFTGEGEPLDPDPILAQIAANSVQTKRDIGPAIGRAAESFLARAFKAAGWLGRSLGDGRVIVRCPWQDQHSDKRGNGQDSSTTILAPNAERPLGQFHCLHQHCTTRGVLAALLALPTAAVESLREVDPAGYSLAKSLVSSAPLRRKVEP